MRKIWKIIRLIINNNEASWLAAEHLIETTKLNELNFFYLSSLNITHYFEFQLMIYEWIIALLIIYTSVIN